MTARRPDAPLRILLWYWGRRGGGMRYTLEMAKALAGMPDVQLHLSLSRHSEAFDAFERLGVPGFHTATYSSLAGAAFGMRRLPGLRAAFRDYLAKNRIDVVDCTMHHLWNPAVAGAVGRAGARYLLTLHDALLHPGEESAVRSWLLRRDIARADGVVTLTRHVQEQLCSVYGFPRERSWIVPHGAFRYAASARPRQLPRDRKVRLLFFGRILPYKGLAVLLDAMKLLNAAGDPVELAIVGPGDIAPYRAAAAALGNASIDNRWIPEEEIADIFARCDIVVTPYVEASQSGVIPVAFDAGAPVVATPVGGLVEQVRHGRTGLIAPSAEAHAIAAAIRTLARDPEMYRRMSENALAEAAGSLSWTAIAARIAEIGRGLKATRGAAPCAG